MNKELLLIAKLKRDAAAALAAQAKRDSAVVVAVEAKAERGVSGSDGVNGEVGPQGVQGADGADGVNGKDAPTIVSVDIDFDNRLVVTMSDGTQIVTEGVVNILRGKQGPAGPRGADGADGNGGGDCDNCLDLDGGTADSVYTSEQIIQGGTA